jgi:type I restriction enzyme S subunit
MNTDVLLKQFDRISDAPDAIQRLRRFVLDLAVRGKLVEQNPSDEPGTVLLKSMQGQRCRLIRQGTLRQEKPLPTVATEDIPFTIPTNWGWARIGETSTLITKGSTPTSYGHSYQSSGVNFIKVEAIRDGQLLPQNVTSFISDETHAFMARSRLAVGDILFSIAGSIGTCACVSERVLPANTNQALAIIRGTGIVFNPTFVLFCIKSSVSTLILSKARGGAMNNISLEDVRNFLVPVPPLAEQHRIVAKVDELMAMCDRLEETDAERERRREQVTAAIGHHLNNGVNPEAARKHASFYVNHLPTITTRPEQIPALREAILNLAVRGCIVLQDENDEPVSKLLERIHEEQQRLISAGTIPKSKVRPSDARAELAFEPPKSWEPITFGRLCNIVTSGSRGWAEYYSESGPKFIRAQNIRFGRLRLNDLACVNPPKKSEGTRTQVSKGDLLVVITGAGVTNPALLETDLGEAYVSQHVALIKPTDTNLSRWLLLCLMAPMGGRAELVTRAYGAGKPGLNLDNIRSLHIPLPPLAEQRRIVEKVNALMDLCDQLETRLAATQSESRRLLEALLHHALNDALESASPRRLSPQIDLLAPSAHSLQ